MADKLMIRVKEQFYHPRFGRLPHKRANKTEPFSYNRAYIKDLPSDAEIVEGTDEDRAQLAALHAKRKDNLAEAKKLAKRLQEQKSMEGFIGAMQQLQAMMSGVKPPAAPVEVPKAATVVDEDDEQEDEQLPGQRRGRRRRVA
jgi:hypothetical protein